MKKKTPTAPKPRAKQLHDLLLSKKGGKHVEKDQLRSHRKSETRKEINKALGGSNWNPLVVSGGPRASVTLSH